MAISNISLLRVIDSDKHLNINYQGSGGAIHIFLIVQMRFIWIVIYVYSYIDQLLLYTVQGVIVFYVTVCFKENRRC